MAYQPVNIDQSIKLSEFNVLLEPFELLVNQTMEQFEKEDILKYIFLMQKSDKYREEIRTRLGMGEFAPVPDMGTAKLDNWAEGHRKQFKHTTWMNSFQISKQTLEDKQSGQINTETTGFLQGYRRGRFDFGLNVLAAGLTGEFTYQGQKFKVSSYDSIDGTIEGLQKQLLFHKNHMPAETGKRTTSQSNKFYAIAPNYDEEKFLEILGMVEEKALKVTDDNNKIERVRPKLIVVPHHYKQLSTIKRALNTTATSKMGDNGINIEYGRWTLIPSIHLAEYPGFGPDDNAFILIDPDYNTTWKGGIWYDRVPLEIDVYYDKENKSMKVDGRARYSADFFNWRYIYYCTIVDEDLPSTANIANDIVNSKADSTLIYDGSVEEEEEEEGEDL